MTKSWLPMNVVNALSSNTLLDFNHTLLIVDNKSLNLSFLIEYLKDYGFKIIVAQNCDIGLKIAQTIQPDLILWDAMPSIDSLETCDRLKADEDSIDIPVIFMTTQGRAEEKLKEFKGVEVRGVYYVTQPIQHEVILELVITHILLAVIRQLQNRNQELYEANQMVKRFIQTKKVCCRLQLPRSNQA